MLERSLNAVEKASADGGVYPEVMFEVGRHWCYLFEKHASSSSAAAAGGGGNNAPPSAAGGGGARHSAMAAAQPHHPPQLRPDQFNPVQGASLALDLSITAPQKTYYSCSIQFFSILWSCCNCILAVLSPVVWS